MPKIRILADRVANQIAAGEVIERPVAVMKELVENSIDAGATRIEIDFKNGGKSYIRIADNGHGMAPDEAMLALERHATSKIRSADDLNHVHSFGFRGEALPSIASVSRFSMKTRDRDWPHGCEIRVNGGKLVDRRDCGMAVGTVIEVAHLFNSVPARRKFLKTDATETAHIVYTARLFAVAHPGIAFRVSDGGRVLFESPQCTTLLERIREIWGAQMARDLIPLDVSDPESGLVLSGLTAKPGVGRATRRELVTLVNCRPVDSRTLGFAVLDAYHGRIQSGRYPPAFLFLKIAPDAVDANVHPAKREIRFRNEGQVRRFVLAAVTDCLDAHGRPRSSVEAPVEPAAPTALPEPPAAPRPAPVPPAPAPCRASSAPVGAAVPTPPRPALDWRLVARFQKRFALFETASGLVMLHVRNADQRVRYERIEQQAAGSPGEHQPLLMPLPIEFEPLATAALSEHIEHLQQQGFAIEPFGNNFFRVSAAPAWLDPAKLEDFLRDLVDALRQRSGERSVPGFGMQAIARVAVKEAYRRDDQLSDAAVVELASALMACRNPHTAPSGQPTYRQLSWTDWTRYFKEGS